VGSCPAVYSPRVYDEGYEAEEREFKIWETSPEQEGGEVDSVVQEDRSAAITVRTINR